VIEVGRRNGSVARTLLSSAGIPVVSESLFGVGHRQIIFDVAQGHVWSRQIRPVAHSNVNSVTNMEAVA
jgi:chemotaxis protein CheD